jgi:hypothetical protein
MLDAVSFVPGGLRVAGWAIDPDTADPIDVHAYVNGGGFNLGAANKSRPDVGRAFPGFGDNHGYDAMIPWTSPGSTTICVYGINVGAPDTNPRLGCGWVDVGPFGSLDIVSTASGGLRVAGWAIDPETADPIEVHVYVNGGGFNLGAANKSRPDVGNVYPVYGPIHGFDTVIPWTAPGSTTVCAYAISASGNGPNRLLGCR